MDSLFSAPKDAEDHLQPLIMAVHASAEWILHGRPKDFTASGVPAFGRITLVFPEAAQQPDSINCGMYCLANTSMRLCSLACGATEYVHVCVNVCVLLRGST